MKYLAMIMIDPHSEDARDYAEGKPTDPKFAEAMGKHVAELTARGVLLETAGLLPPAMGTRVRAAGGRLTVTDGPFIESKEIIGGYAMLRTNSKEEAVELGKEFMNLHLEILGPSYEGVLEIRQMFDPADGCGGSAKN